MTETSPHPTGTLDDLPETIHLVNEELQNQQVKFHIYVEREVTRAAYASDAPDSCHKPRCGQDGRKRYDTAGLIEIPTTDILEHLLPGMCRRCLDHMGLPQPETDVMGGKIVVTETNIQLIGGDETERVLDVSHPYRQ